MPFILDYYILAFVASCGVLQMAATYSRLRGLLFFKNLALNLAAAAVFTVGSFVWFFSSEPRNLPDSAGGLNGNQQVGLFVLASASAVIFSFIVSSIHPLQSRQTAGTDSRGLETLKQCSYMTAIGTTLQKLR